MSEPAWVALGAQAVDYEGAYAAGTQYVPGDVVRYNGVDYICVNPALGQTPAATVIPATPPVIPLVTTLPASPFDGQEVILTDSLTAPTYSWRFRYVAAKASNRWIFVGGSPLLAEVATKESTSSGTYVDLTTAGPSISIPVAGDYEIGIGCGMMAAVGANQGVVMSYAIGATAASDSDCIGGWFNTAGTTYVESVHRVRRKSLGVVALVAKYRIEVAAPGAFRDRWISARPIAVGG